MLFWYFQLQHVANAQFPRSPVLKAEYIKELLAPRELRKPQSTLYGSILCTDLPRLGETVGGLVGEYPILRWGGLGGLHRTGCEACYLVSG